ncbi:MAG: hypothetical protein AVDCRST_MAG64-3635 [uncultured Phycisphaerae bacterium]|uniref:Uncharacterized protein n=1 Tax=uncultured Phycisphaerae bacterium TaxID=904963 RepID=A0A6J4QB56_9BACT|nr:MAG: hypothetical protein AVDCRST_MAG64-3635 [uncultured Phycisphaerae bacterium]
MSRAGDRPTGRFGDNVDRQHRPGRVPTTGARPGSRFRRVDRALPGGRKANTKARRREGITKGEVG